MNGHAHALSSGLLSYKNTQTVLTQPVSDPRCTHYTSYGKLRSINIVISYVVWNNHKIFQHTFENCLSRQPAPCCTAAMHNPDITQYPEWGSKGIHAAHSQTQCQYPVTGRLVCGLKSQTWPVHLIQSMPFVWMPQMSTSGHLGTSSLCHLSGAVFTELKDGLFPSTLRTKQVLGDLFLMSWVLCL